MKPLKPFVIAIDGHSSCGKSTVAKDLAKHLHFAFIDSGAMYRAITLYAIRNTIISNSQIKLDKLEDSLRNISISFKFDPETKQNITFLNGENVEDTIRTLEVSSQVSAISAIGFVRNHLVKLQQQMGVTKGIVMDGRDIGTVVFPHAELKVFMTASPEVRAQRRFDELTAKGESVSFNDILDNVKERDFIDSNRSISPLKQADDAWLLDNSSMTREEQWQWIMNKLSELNLIA